SYPLTPGHDTNVPQSELLDPANFSANPIAGSPQPAKITGTGATLSPDAPAKVVGAQNIAGFDSGAAATTLVINGVTVNIPANSSETAIRDAINAAPVPN